MDQDSEDSFTPAIGLGSFVKGTINIPHREWKANMGQKETLSANFSKRHG
jgi:hypothetical protein